MIELDPRALAMALTPHWMLRIREFDDLEIQPCMVVSATADGEIVEPCEPQEAHFWTVYGHWATGGVDAVEDFATDHEPPQPRLARSAARALSRLVRAENSPIAHSAFAASRAARASAAASWRFRISFSAFRVSM